MKTRLVINGQTYEIEQKEGGLVVNGAPFKVTLDGQDPFYNVNINGRTYKIHLLQGSCTPYVINVDAKVYKVSVEKGTVVPPRPAAQPAPSQPAAPQQTTPRPAAEKPAVADKKQVDVSGPGAVRTPMPGKIITIKVAEGERVDDGAVLLVLEAMKMENEIRSPIAGTVQAIMVTPGSNVNAGDCLVVVG